MLRDRLCVLGVGGKQIVVENNGVAEPRSERICILYIVQGCTDRV